jgi:hypothetical protein
MSEAIGLRIGSRQEEKGDRGTLEVRKTLLKKLAEVQSPQEGHTNDFRKIDDLACK